MNVAATITLVTLALAVASGPARAGDCVPGLTAAERAVVLDALTNSGESGEAPASTLDDPTLHATILRYARSELGQRVRPRQADPLWAIEPPLRDIFAEYSSARRGGRLTAWMSDLSPPHAEYRALRAEHCRYTQIVDGGGWSPLPPGPSLAPDGRHPTVEALRNRLAIEGYLLSRPAQADLFDPALADALRAFQRRHVLDPDAVLGAETRRALDVSAEHRLLQLTANLERWRWLPHRLPDDRLELDAGAAEAVLYRAGVERVRMRAVVGDPQHKTPMFASRIEAVVLNPPWRVPASIARNEILPRAARDPGYLARSGIRRTAEGGLEQRPGPNNALGQVKFDLPSPFGVYLHDTPGKAAFARPVRTLSHGCMRLEKPRELAEALLADQGWTRASIDRAIAAGATRRLAVAKPVPLFVVYRTAGVDEQGWAVFRPDPYGWDGKLLRALAGTDASAADPALDTECSASTGQASP